MEQSSSTNGRPKRGKPRNVNSVAAWLATFEVGEYRYVETTCDAHDRTLHTLVPAASRMRPECASWKFKRETFTAVANGGKVGETRILIRVERTE